MTARLKLEEFDGGSRPPSSPETAKQRRDAIHVLLEKKRLEGYEAGYQAGWDDASAALTEEAKRIEADFARNLEDLGFTFQEARSHVLSTLEPLLKTMVSKVLPQVAEAAIGSIIAEEITPMAASAADTPIQVLVSPANRMELEKLLSHATSVPFVLVENDALPEGQIYLKSGENERQIDMAGTLDRMRQAVLALYEMNEKAFSHG